MLRTALVLTFGQATGRVGNGMADELTMARTAAGGLAGTAAVVGAMAAARRAGLSELELPRVIATTLGRERAMTRAAGWALFVANGAALALAYRTVLRLSGRRGGVVRGAVLGLAHGLVAVGAAALLSRFHPRPHRAGLISETRPRPPRQDLAVLFAVHGIYGAVVGAFARGRA